ncbi:MAG: hypothetical protein K0S86_2866, partial [Geminicoccaceae bacterium]|nr:hypothetical protein [Geminicoccaceae bacterium]
RIDCRHAREPRAGERYTNWRFRCQRTG